MLERKWWTLIAVCTAIFMLLLDITIVNVALPDIARVLHASFTDLQWVIDAYALSLATLVLTAGSLADLLGRRRVFAAGVAIFTGASVLCALATSPLFLILARAVQGIGGAIMFATSLALLSQAFHGRERGTAFGIWGATTGAAVAVGPLIGGALTQGLGWRWIFFVNIPIGLAALVLTFMRVDESRDEKHGGIDWLGLATFCGSLFLLVFALLRGNDKGWGSPLIVGMLAAAGVLLAAFIAVELRQAEPMFDLTLFRKPAFAGAQITAFALSAAAFSMLLYLTLYLQNILGYSPLSAGLRFLPTTLLSFAVAPVAGKLSAHVPVRALLAGGLALVTVGLLLMSGLDTSSGWTALLPGFVVLGAGIGLVNPPLASAAIGVVDQRRAGMASGINSTFRQVGIATGIAALGALFQHHVQSSVRASLHGSPRAPEIARQIASGGAGTAIRNAPPALRRPLAEAARHAFVTGLNELFLVGAAVAIVGAVCALALVRRRDFVATGAPAASVSRAR
jgi:EmrB/QacA subfamily drug resistance transporter